MKMLKKKGGMTLVEVLIALAIFVSVIVAVGAFEANTFIYSSSVSGAYQTAQNAQIILKTILSEIREMQPSANGSYPLVTTGSTSISFYSDADNSGSAEQITYTLSGTTLYRAVIKPTGTPASYLSANQSTSTLMTNVTNGTSIPVFEYFDTNYNGTSSPLAQPVTATNVRLIKANLRLDLDPNRSPLPIIYTVQASLRNLKSNL